MIEYENVKEALESVYELTEATNIKVDGKEITVEELQEFIRERVINLCDLLGHENIYLGE